MSKDPAFLMYSKDWIEGTAELSTEAKGVYIDLLCYQHQRGSLPSDPEKLSRLTRTTTEVWEKIWEELKDKFNQVDNRLVNHKLKEVMSDRSVKAKKNKIVGIFATLIRTKGSTYKASVKKAIKEAFKPDDFMDLEDPEITERLTTWYNQTVNNILEDANENEKEDVILPFKSQRFARVWEDEWIPFRKKMKWPCNPVGLNNNLKDLYSMSEGSTPIAIKIIKQSMDKSWQGLFPLKNNGSSGSVKNSSPGSRYRNKTKLDMNKKTKTLN